MDKVYVLDTSALLVLIQSEPGVESVENILNLAKKKKTHIYLSFISLLEIYYVMWREKGENVAKKVLVLVKNLPLEVVESYERLTLLAGRIKANHRLSVADGIIAATALEKKAILVHKDPEIEALSPEVSTLALPFKLPINK